MLSQQEVFMKQVIELAKSAVDEGEKPFATLIVKDKRILAKAINQSHRTKDPTDHAEIAAVRQACRTLESEYLHGCDVYTIGHPCPMCLTCLILTKPDHVYFATTLEEKNRSLTHLRPGLDLYEELKKPYQQRVTPMTKLESCAPEAIEVFQRWNERPNNRTNS